MLEVNRSTGIEKGCTQNEEGKKKAFLSGHVNRSCMMMYLTLFHLLQLLFLV